MSCAYTRNCHFFGQLSSENTMNFRPLGSYSGTAKLYKICQNMEISLRLHIDEGRPRYLYYYIAERDLLLDPYLFTEIKEEIGPEDITIATLDDLYEDGPGGQEATRHDEPLLFIYTSYGTWYVLTIDFQSRLLDLASLGTESEDLNYLAGDVAFYEFFKLYRESIPGIPTRDVFEEADEEEEEELDIGDIRVIMGDLVKTHHEGLYQFEHIAYSDYKDDTIQAPFGLSTNLLSLVEESENFLLKTRQK